MKKILFLSWQGGLGHITRDLAIIKELHRQNSQVQVCWMAHPLACRLLQQAGEEILPESAASADYNAVGINAISGFKLNLMTYVNMSRPAWAQNVALFKQVSEKYSFDLIVGDESYEITDALQAGTVQPGCRMVMIEDFIGLEAMRWNPLELLGIYQNNRGLALQAPLLSSRVLRFFVGEVEDVPNRPFGPFLPNRREFASKYYHFLGYVIRFDPADYRDKARIKTQLGYGNEPLLLCATGGLSAGMEMLTTCGKAYTLLKKNIPDLHMVAVCGELFGKKPPELPPEVEVHSYLPDLYRHYAACDMAVVVGGGTTTIELTALRRPFIFFPLENQFDQQRYLAERLARHGAGIKMRFYQTTPEALAEVIQTHIGKDGTWPPISVDGAQKGASLLVSYL